MTTTNTRSAMKFRKRPIVIEAILWNGNNLRDVIEFTNGPPNLRTQHARMRWDDYESLVQDSGLRIYTLEGAMLANVGDMIVRGVQGELYPCKPDIFAATYDPVDPTLIEAATAEQGAGRREEISDLEGLAILLDGYARDRKRDKLPKTSDVLAAAASHLRAYAAALRPSASAGGEYQRGIEDSAKAAENVGVVYKANASALGVSNSARRQIATAIRALTPSPAVPEVDGAAQEMLVAFAEGVEWTDEKRAAYDALSRAISVVPEVAK